MKGPAKGDAVFWKKTPVFMGFLLAFSVFFVYGVVSLSSPKPLSDEKVIERFNKIYYESAVWGFNQTSWLGIPNMQNPADMWMMQQIITKVKPDFIIETGTFHGGSSLFYATVLEKINQKGKVITIDIKRYIDRASRFDVFKKHVEFIQGNSVSPEVIRSIARKVKGRKVLVTLDSLHTKEHVLREIELYSPFVSIGSYLVVQDTNVNGHPVRPDFGEGPMEAVREFLAKNKDFEIDPMREKFLLTFYPSGYLKRIR